ncbi:MAG: hypothetical protein DVB26_00070 [Verrucomicrobia bacterium]|nr:MAG: hypothetical protein DVB26_00070 [Verrucomicrobiota bacterium]
MANVFGILTAIVLTLASFVAYKNKDAYANELTHRQNEDSKLAATEARFKTAQKSLAETQAKHTEGKQQVAKLATEKSDLETANAAVKQEVDSKTAVMDDNKSKLDKMKEQAGKIGKARDSAEKVKTLGAEMEELKLLIAKNLAQLDSLTKENSQTAGRNDVLKGRTDMISRRESFFTKAEINAIYPNWGFVTLSAGNISGVVAGSTLEIVRDAKAVGKLLVTAVEANTASASIVPDSLVDGSVLMVGDQVVPTHKPVEIAKAPVSQPAAAATKAPAKDAEPAAESTMDPAPGAAAEPDATPAATPDATPEAPAAAAPEAN